MSKAEYTRDTLPPLTKAQQDDLKRLAAMPDDGVLTDDMPELPETLDSAVEALEREIDARTQDLAPDDPAPSNFGM